MKWTLGIIMFLVLTIFALTLALLIESATIYAMSEEIAIQDKIITKLEQERGFTSEVLKSLKDIRENCSQCNCTPGGRGATGWVKPTGDTP